MPSAKTESSASEARRRRRRRAERDYRLAVLRRAALDLLGAEVCDIEFPGGSYRESCRLLFSDRDPVIATHRSALHRALRESRILKALSAQQAPVPQLYAHNGALVLMQQELQGERLSATLQRCAEQDAHQSGEQWLDAALTALLTCQKVGHAAALEIRLPQLGYETRWIQDLSQRAMVLSQYLEIKAPEQDDAAICARLQAKSPQFIKWDSRPGNALCNSDGAVYWFDWEHAGCRDPLDDLAWVLGDEFVPDWPEAEARLLDRYIPAFGADRSPEQAREYFMSWGTFHLLVRLGLILRYKSADWWSLEDCIEHDRVGVTLTCVQRLCARGRRWSAQAPLLAEAGYPDWFERAQRVLES